MKRFLFKSSAILLSTAFFPSVLLAEQLRIVDSVGLIRAAHSVRNSGTVTMTLIAKGGDTNFPDAVTLTNVDGLSADIKARNRGNGVCQASAVPAGTWKITYTSKSFEIRDVKISQ